MIKEKELCTFITCGSVDDGKSTLIGRMLYDCKILFEDQILCLKKDSKKFGNAGEKLDFSLLVDGLLSEREQGITIDVAYRFFASKRRKFIIADTPGHEQYTKNMATGASTADIAIILMDARKGVLSQTKRHSYIASLFGIKQFIIAVNKMDLIAFDEGIFHRICKDYEKIIAHLKTDIHFHFIPICALDGDNIRHKSSNTTWYKGKTLYELLDTLPIYTQIHNDFIMSVQYINRANLDLRAFCGNIASGSIGVHDEIMVLPSLKSTRVRSIINSSMNFTRMEHSSSASFPSAISLILEDEIDISRGDILVAKKSKFTISNSFKAMIIWMSEAKFENYGNYVLKLAHSISNIESIDIEMKKDINSFEELISHELAMNDIAKCTLQLDRKIALKTYDENKTLGSFIIIDKYSNQTLAAGMVEELLDSLEHRNYTQAEIELNAYIRKNYPQWGCKKI